MKLKNKILSLLAASAFVVTVPVVANTIYTNTTITRLGNGVTYELQRRITRAGRVDVHIIEVDLTAEGIALGPVTGENFASRNTTSNLLADAGAVAGINADFFDMSRNPSTALGQVIQNGEILEFNERDAGFFTFMVDVFGNPLIRYLEPEIMFLNNGNRGFSIRAYNHLSSQIISTVFDRRAFHNTQSLVDRHPYIVTIVVDDGVIINITEPGEAVYIPRYGFIIAVRDSYFNYFKNSTLIGNTAEILFDAAYINLENIWQAVSGAGLILQNGDVVNVGYVPGRAARHPRSAIGINYDGTTVYLVAVDGRGASIGATHAELGFIMQSIGAYNAMHFDGGGSTSLGVLRPGGSLTLANTPSDGAQRRVVNALGVFNTAPRDVLIGLDIHSSFNDFLFLGDNITINSYGINAHLERLPLNDEYLRLNVYPYIMNVYDTFFPIEPGVLQFSVSYEDFIEEFHIEVLELGEIVPSHTFLSVSEGDSRQITFTGRSPLGYEAPLPTVNVEFYPLDLGHFTDGTLYVTGSTSGVMRASRGSIYTYISINIDGDGYIIPLEGNSIPNPYLRSLPPAGFGFDITVVGDVSVLMSSEDEIAINTNIRNEALNGFRTGATVGVFAGTTEIETVPSLATISRVEGYRFHIIYNSALINLDARLGSLTNTTPYNWSFAAEVNSANVENAIFMLNRSIYSLTRDDREMLINSLENLSRYVSVFLIQTGTNYTSADIRNGVNYISLAGLFKYVESEYENYENEENEGYYVVNYDFAVLRFRTSEGEIHFDIQHVFE